MPCHGCDKLRQRLLIMRFHGHPSTPSTTRQRRCSTWISSSHRGQTISTQVPIRQSSSVTRGSWPSHPHSRQIYCRGGCETSKVHIDPPLRHPAPGCLSHAEAGGGIYDGLLKVHEHDTITRTSHRCKLFTTPIVIRAPTP